MGSLSLTHWLIVLAIALVIFGTKRVRNLGSDLGVALRDFRKGLHEPDSPDASAIKAESGASPNTVTVEEKDKDKRINK